MISCGTSCRLPKTIQLIGARIDQMDAYLQTRQKSLTKWWTNISNRFSNSNLKRWRIPQIHQVYVGDDQSYLDSVIQTFVELQQKAPKYDFFITIDTTIGVVAAILGISAKTLCRNSLGRLVLFRSSLAMTWLLNGGREILQNKNIR